MIVKICLFGAETVNKWEYSVVMLTTCWRLSVRVRNYGGHSQRHANISGGAGWYVQEFRQALMVKSEEKSPPLGLL